MNPTPAHSLESEKAVLGGVLLHPASWVQVAPIVAAPDFYHPAHRALYEAAAYVDEQGQPLDPLTVWNALEHLDIADRLKAFDGREYLTVLAGEVVTVENIAYHARVVRSKAERRRIAAKLGELHAKAYGDAADDEFFAAVDGGMLALGERRGTGKGVTMRKALRQWTERLGKIYQAFQSGGGQVIGIPTGWAAFDAFTGGLRIGEQTVLAGRPKMGKTAGALQAVVGAAMAGVPVLLFSLEMQLLALLDRIVSSASNVPASTLRNGDLHPGHWVAITKATAVLADLPITIDDECLTMAEITARALRWRATEAKGHDKALIATDYLQLVGESEGRDSRERKVSEISAGGKRLAKAANAHHLILAQLNRKCEDRQDKRPMASDLRDSGSIEQDADMVAFLYRDDVYNNAPDNPMRGTAELIVGMNRNGPTGTLWFDFDGEHQRFTEREAPNAGNEAAAHWQDR